MRWLDAGSRMIDMKQSGDRGPVSQRTGGWTWTSRRVRLIAFSLAVLARAGGVASAASYYVATDGVNSNPGTLSQPFATLENAARTATSGDIVYVRGGTYYRTSTLALSSAQNGVTFRNYPGETPILVGGLPITNWSTYSGNILRADVSGQGYSGVHFGQLFANGARQILARTPNYNGIGTNSYYFVSSSGSQSTFTTAGNLGSPTNQTELSVSVFPQWDYWNDIVPVSSISGSTVNLNGTTDYAMQTGDRFFIQGSLNYLDVAGEWYLDSNNKWLYFYPSNSIASLTVTAPMVNNFVNIGVGAQNITWQGFTMQGCDGSAITLTNTTNCLIAANTIHDVGNYNEGGIRVHGGFTNAIVGNDISYVGRDGILIKGGNAGSTLTPANNYADNNYIHDTGVYYKEGGGIKLTGLAGPGNGSSYGSWDSYDCVGNRASRNTIFNCPSFGIYFWGQNLLIQSNHVYNCMLETDDGGCIYTEGFAWRGVWGCRVENNYVHDAVSYGYLQGSGTYGTPSMGAGIYIDNYANGVTVNSNIIAFNHWTGVLINGGDECGVTNNVLFQNQPLATASSSYGSLMLDNNSASHSDGFGSYSWPFPGFTSPGPSTYCYSNSFYHNAAINTNGPNVTFVEWLLPGTGTYQDYDDYYTSGNYHDTAGDGTFYWYPIPQTFVQWQASSGLDAHSVFADPLIQAQSDFSFAVNSGALSLGIQSLSTNMAGVYNDVLRASWPAGQAAGGLSLSSSPPSPPEHLHTL